MPTIFVGAENAFLCLQAKGMTDTPKRPVGGSASGSQRVPVSLGADPLLGRTSLDGGSRHPVSALTPSTPTRKTTASAPTISAASVVGPLPGVPSSNPEHVVNVKRKKIVSEAPENIEGLRCMMRVGAWKDSLKLAEKLYDSEKKPYEKLQFKLMVLVALMHLRDYKGALMEVEGLGNLHTAAYNFENYPQYYADKKGSMVPFSLFVLSAELYQLAEPTHAMRTIDLLYHLLSYCRSQIQHLEQTAPIASPGNRPGSPAVQSPRRSQRKVKRESKEVGKGEEDVLGENKIREPVSKGLEGLLDEDIAGSGDEGESSESDSGLSIEDLESSSPKFITPPSSPTFLRRAVQHSLYFDELNPTQQVWRLREVRVMFTIATYLVRMLDLSAAIMVLQEIQEMYPRDPILVSCIGRVQLQLGNLEMAQKLFDQAEDMLGNPSSPIVLSNKGHFHMANNNFKGAARQFQKVLDHEPNNLTVINNRAICWLYTCNLQRAISSLEEVILRDPENTIRESIVFNLSTLYDLGAEECADKKKKLLALIAKFGPDDSFDSSILRI